MKKIKFIIIIVLTLNLFLAKTVQSQTSNTYISRFLQMHDRIHDPNSGYFSKDGAPYHSVETLMCEAPDQGHETTSESYSFYVWLEAMYGRAKGDWKPLNTAWSTVEGQAIPTHAMQPDNKFYVSGGGKATYASEFPLPNNYPSQLQSSVPVGTEPVSAELAKTYNTPDIYGMHWLFDCDNFYGFGNFGDGKSTPSYINTFERGAQESTWETVPHPSIETFNWGNTTAGGYLSLFVKDNSTPAKQWRYTNAPDADARSVQAIYWASVWAKQQGLNPLTTVPVAKASKMGDYLRLAMFDKYYKPIGAQDINAAGATEYGSCHYLMSWYYAWGGPMDTTQGWAWRIGCSHSHFGYQNPLTAYVLSTDANMKPQSAKAPGDWATSLQRQVEMYSWLQSSEGAIAGGCTNSWNGDYEKYPTGVSTFYNMAYVSNPVYLDPGSNTWFGFQAWSVERLAEYYYLNNDPMAKKILDKWVGWVKTVIKLPSDGTFQIPSSINWTGQPDTWNSSSPGSNANLHVVITQYGTDLGITACLAKALTYYAAATKKYGTLDNVARSDAQALLDRMWNLYWEGSTGKGCGVRETRLDFRRFDSTIYVPDGWSGKMPNGDVIKPGVTFLDIRTNYKKDTAYTRLRADLTAGITYSTVFHRFWAEADIALANAEYGFFFGDTTVVPVTGVTVSPTTVSVGIGATSQLTATVAPSNATNQAVTWSSSNTSVATVSSTGLVTGVAAGTANITVTTVDGAKTATSAITVTSTCTPTTITPYVLINGGSWAQTSTATLAAGGSVEFGPQPVSGGSWSWSGPNGFSATTREVTISNIQTNQAGNYVATYTNTNGCNSTNTFVVTVTTTGTLPSPWQTSDIGSVAAAGSASYSSGIFTEAGSGADIWNTADGFRYVYQPVSGNVEIIARVASLTNTDNWAKAGVMVRQSLTAGSIHAITVVTSGNGIAFQNRTSTDGNSNHTAASGSAPYWVRLVVSGSTVTSYASSDGSSWTQIGSVSLGLSGTYYVGLCVTSHNDGTLCTSTIDNVTVNTGTTVSVTGVTVSPASASVNVGSTTSLTATVSPSNATNKNVSWSSSNISVATVSSTGVVTGVAAGSATITVTTADGGFTATSTITVSGACTTCGCTFGAPTATALPSVNKSYNYGYVLGTGGPNMSNLSNFTINWDLANNGLYQFSMLTTDGKPNWYNDLRTGASQNFASAQPSITLSGTGFTGLDGSYYATVYNGDFVLVSKAGGFTIYFSNSTTAPSCTKSAREVTGVDVLSANVFSIFPNPVNKDASVFVNLKTQAGGASFFITDLSGKIIITGNLMSSDNSIALNGKLSSGIYFVRITNGNEQFNQKLIVK